MLPYNSKVQSSPSQVIEQAQSDTDGGKARFTTSSSAVNIQSKRVEHTSGVNFLHCLKVSLTQPLKKLREWLRTQLGRNGDTHSFSEDLHIQHTELTKNSAEQRRQASGELRFLSQERLKSTDHMIPAAHPLGSNFKTVLDIVSQLSTSTKIKQEQFDVTLNSQQVEILQGDINGGSASFAQIENMVKTRGDLQLVRTLALSPTPDVISKPPTIEAALANLATICPNTSVFLGGLMEFLQLHESLWWETTEGNEEKRGDAQAQSDFNNNQLEKIVNRLNAYEAHKILEQLEGYFGQRAHGLIWIASDKLVEFGDIEDKSVGKLMSRLTRADSLLDGLIHQLRAKLGMSAIEIPIAPTIESLNKLNPLELAALVNIGIKLK